MEEYIVLKRPKRKLCYPARQESVPEQWNKTITLGDVDKMFDGPDSPSAVGTLVSSLSAEQSDLETSPVSHDTPVKDKLQQTGPEDKALLPEVRLCLPTLDGEFGVDKPVKTSSPIEANIIIKHVEHFGSEEVVSPILSDYEDEENSGAAAEPPPVLQLNEDSELDSPPSMLTIGKPAVTSHKIMADKSCKASQAVEEKNHTVPPAPVSGDEGNTSGEEIADTHIETVKPASELVSPENQSTSADDHSVGEASTTRTGKDMPAFLQRLRDAVQTKPPRSRTPVKVSPPPVASEPEPEDDFLILEDDAPLCFSIPSRTVSRQRQKQSGGSSTDRDISTDKGTNDSPQEAGQKEEEPIKRKTKRKKPKEKKSEAAEPEFDPDVLPTPEDVPAADPEEPEEPEVPIKRKKFKKLPSTETDEAEERVEDAASGEKEDQIVSRKAAKKIQKSSVLKRSKSSKEGEVNKQTSRRKGTRKAKPVKEAVNNEVMKEQRENQSNGHTDVNSDSIADPPVMDSVAQAADSADGRLKHNDLPAVSEGSSTDEGQILGKRRRKQSRQWWLIRPQSTEETSATDNLQTLKRSSKMNHIESGPSPGQAAAESKALKKKNRKKSASSSRRRSVKEAKNTRTKRKRAADDEKKTKKAAEEVLNSVEAERVEQQQDEAVLEQDPDPVDSSPLLFPYRDNCSTDQVFARVYPPASAEKPSKRPAPVTPTSPAELPAESDSGKRRRRPPGDWWTVGNAEEEQNLSFVSPPLQPKLKEPKKRPKPSRSPGPKTPTAGTSKPLADFRATLLKPKPLSAPKSVKRSLATFKDIFTSTPQTSGLGSSRDTAQNTRDSVSGGPAEEEITVIHTGTEDGLLSMGGAEFRSLERSHTNQNGTHESRSQLEHTLKDIRSGPSSLIEMEQIGAELYPGVSPPSVPAMLCSSDFCSLPLRPLTLQPKDRANLTEWLKSIWAPTVDGDADIITDQFDWYFYQGRAMGYLADFNSGTICNGKILLGSYMKKPLWVDHCATTVFNLLTSSVTLTIDGDKSVFNPGQSFMVECGQAYSIQNHSAQPAVLYFTRILTESPD